MYKFSKSFTSILSLLAIVFSLVLPNTIYATGSNQTSSSTSTTTTSTGCSAESKKLGNLKILGYDFGNPSACVTFMNILGFLLYIGRNLIGIGALIAIIYIMVGGITIVLAAGNEEQVRKGKSTLTYAVGGFILAALAYIIVSTFLTYIAGQSLENLPTQPTDLGGSSSTQQNNTTNPAAQPSNYSGGNAPNNNMG
jgi:hypothetical protein